MKLYALVLFVNFSFIDGKKFPLIYLEESVLEMKNTKIITNFFEKYFEKQQTIKIFSINNDDWCDKILQEFYNKKNFLAFGNHSQNLEKPAFAHNFGYLTVIKKFNDSILSSLDDVNTVGPWLVITPSNESHEILKVAWDRYRMLHLVILVFSQKDDCFVVNFYNPFLNFLHVKLLKDESQVEGVIHEIKTRDRDLHGYELRVFMNSAVKTYAIPVYDAFGKVKRYKGIDGEILEGLRVGMNFNVSWLTYSDDQIYTEVEDDINRLILARKIDVLAVAYPSNTSLIGNVYPLYTIEPTYFVCLVKTRQDKYTIDVVYGSIDFSTTVLLCVSMIILSLLLFLIRQVFDTLTNDENITSFLLEILGIIASISRPLQKYQQINLRMLLLCAFILNLTTTSVLQASIFTDLNLESDTKQINSIQSLIEDDIKVYSYDLFANFIDGRLRKQVVINLRANEGVSQDISDGTLKNYGTLALKYQAKYFRARILDNRTGEHTLHLVKEPILSILMPFHVPFWSPFVEIMDEMMLRLLETGLRQKGFNDADVFVYLEKIRTMKKLQKKVLHKESRPQPITMETMNKVFEVYLWMMSVAFLMSIIEIIYFKIQRKICNTIRIICKSLIRI